jgi:putative transcriptional regulator
MATKKKQTESPGKKRNIFQELMDGMAEMKAHREGKLTLRRYKRKMGTIPAVDAKTIREIREQLNVSRTVFARQLFINERTLEKWEQGRARPNTQAAALILMTRKHPDTLRRLEELAP